MKKKKLLAAALSVILTVSTAISSYAFYQDTGSIKGLHITGLGAYEDMQNLGCTQAIWNVRADDIVNGMAVNNDRLLKENKDHGISNTIIIQNQWQTNIPQLLPTAEPAAGAVLYGFNVSTQEGIDATQKIAKEWAQRYKDVVSGWVIGNEVNDGNRWNYLPTQDLTEYTTQYARAYRIWYDAIKEANPDARVYIPFDYRWNWPGGNGAGYYQAKEMMPILNNLLRDTDYGVAWHAYPQELADPNFMDDPSATDSLDSPIINMKNLHVLTDFMQQADYLSPSGAVRHIILSEQGFTDEKGEDAQAQAIQLAYQKAKENPYIEAFFLNREMDIAGGEDGHYFGIKKADGTHKQAYDAYKNAN